VLAAEPGWPLFTRTLSSMREAGFCRPPSAQQIRYRLRFQFFIPGTVDRCTMPSLGDRLDSSKAVDLFWFSIRMA
jgi:hypothetical protein